MIVGKVVGSIVSTRKSDKLIGQKFMIVEPVHHMKTDLSQIVAIDIINDAVQTKSDHVNTKRHSRYTPFFSLRDSNPQTAGRCSFGVPHQAELFRGRSASGPFA